MFENEFYGHLQDGEVTLYYKLVQTINSKVYDMLEEDLFKEAMQLVEYCQSLENSRRTTNLDQF